MLTVHRGRMSFEPSGVEYWARCKSMRTQSLRTLQKRETEASPRAARKLLGIFTRKERWGLSWLGWVVLVLVLLTLGYVSVLRAYPFLSVTDRVDANILVVEGWVHPYAARTAVEEFNASAYLRVFSTGGPVNGIGGYI